MGAAPHDQERRQRLYHLLVHACTHARTFMRTQVCTRTRLYTCMCNLVTMQACRLVQDKKGSRGKKGPSLSLGEGAKGFAWARQYSTQTLTVCLNFNYCFFCEPPTLFMFNENQCCSNVQTLFSHRFLGAIFLSGVTTAIPPDRVSQSNS